VVELEPRGSPLFRIIDAPLWHRVRHNPLDFLCQVIPPESPRCASDSDFLRQYDDSMARMVHALTTPDTWFNRHYPGYRDGPVAYFCAEFGLHAFGADLFRRPRRAGRRSLQVGFRSRRADDRRRMFYIKGYFDQRLRLDGWQQDSDEEYDVTRTPLEPVVGPNREPVLATVETAGRPVQVRAWRHHGRPDPVYLLDNQSRGQPPRRPGPDEQLYAGGPALRLRQEWILGAGGGAGAPRHRHQSVGVARHEGHAAFMMLERIRSMPSRACRSPRLCVR